VSAYLVFFHSAPADKNLRFKMHYISCHQCPLKTLYRVDMTVCCEAIYRLLEPVSELTFNAKCRVQVGVITFAFDNHYNHYNHYLPSHCLKNTHS
jgi:hypothetical protein